MRSDIGVALATVTAVLLSAWPLGCSVYDPDQLAPPKLPPVEDDGGMSNEPPKPVVCKSGDNYAVCTRPHADGVCLEGACTIVRCHEGYSDCDDLTDNGCEATLATSDNCGTCGERCTLQNVARYLCQTGDKGAQCAIDRGCLEGDTNCVADSFGNGCEEGFADCDALAANGCETSLHTLSHCGSCTKVCAQDVTEASCETGKCVFVGCPAGAADCDDGDGCKSLTDDASNCGECGHVCTADAPMCFGGKCTTIKCGTATADCDAKVSNECEADLTSVDSCGSCTTRCGPYDHATAGCAAQQCAISKCDDGFIDCDEARDNGCETDSTQIASCGTCGHDCGALAHVSSSKCADGQCSDLECESGWGNCDDNPDNGCEQSLNTMDDCQKCGQSCDPAHAVATCEMGSCVVSSCEDGFDDCNGQPGDGCEAALDSDDDCGKCDNACPAGNACKNGGCSCKDNSGCEDGATCCDGACIYTSSTCFPWPCIPGTTADKNNCGGCGEPCLLWCCF